MDWFSSDWHLGHENIIKTCNRPFASVEEMNASILFNMIEKIQKGDTLYFIGDLAFSSETARKTLEFFRLNRIHFVWILGNHDHHCQPMKLNSLCREITQNLIYKNKEKNLQIHLNHFPMRVWHNSYRNSFQLFGHVHTSSPELDFLEQPPYGKSLNVNLEFHDYLPYSLEEVIEIMKNKPDNVDYTLLQKQRLKEKNE